MNKYLASPKSHHVVIIGGAFGGLYAAQALKHAPVEVRASSLVKSLSLCFGVMRLTRPGI